MNSRAPSSATAIPRGFWASLSVAVTRSVAVSMIEIDAEPSFGTYASGAANAPAAQAPASSLVQHISRSMSRGSFPLGSASVWIRADDRLCYTSFCAGLAKRADMTEVEHCKWICVGVRILLAVATVCGATAAAQVPERLDPVVITATRTEERA